MFLGNQCQQQFEKLIFTSFYPVLQMLTLSTHHAHSLNPCQRNYDITGLEVCSCLINLWTLAMTKNQTVLGY